MKRTCLFLLGVIAIVCAKQFYDVYVNNSTVKSYTTGSLSDIADEVVAIPLEHPEEYSIEKVRSVQKDAHNLFLISNEVLYRFNREGKFICCITNPKEIKVAGYVINQSKNQLIVLGNKDDIFYYSYEGVLLEKKKLKSDFSEARILSMSMFKDHIWTTEEHLSVDSLTQKSFHEKKVVEYDSSFHRVSDFRLTSAELGREAAFQGCLNPCISVDKQTGSMFAYTTPFVSDFLLRDTLYLKNRWRGQVEKGLKENLLTLFPVRPGERFWVSSYYNKYDQAKSYTFCYDSRRNASWKVDGGLKDNFYDTGSVPRLEAMDLYTQSYYFCKSGHDVKRSFPEKAQADSTVIFIVKLKAV